MQEPKRLNTLDIKVPFSHRFEDRVVFRSLREITQRAIELGEDHFMPSFTTPDVFTSTIEILQKKTGDEEASKKMVIFDLTRDFGADIAQRIIDYVVDYDREWEGIKTMWKTGMQRQAIEYMSHKKPIEGDNLDDMLSQLVDDINAGSSNETDGEGDNPLGDIWNI